MLDGNGHKRRERERKSVVISFISNNYGSGLACDVPHFSLS